MNSHLARKNTLSQRIKPSQHFSFHSTRIQTSSILNRFSIMAADDFFPPHRGWTVTTARAFKSWFLPEVFARFFLSKPKLSVFILYFYENKRRGKKLTLNIIWLAAFDGAYWSVISYCMRVGLKAKLVWRLAVRGTSTSHLKFCIWFACASWFCLFKKSFQRQNCNK